ncbi:alanine racemase [Enterovirga sp. GCM10030262]|uniref:alanine racemase n=1 Tax=Enterovirga sp. GCM10030262 TaxID=3273391 RepID=UPI00361FA191
MELSDLFTPALILDRGRLEANCEAMRERCRRLGVGLRPHMKTLKSIDAARIAIDPEHGGIAVSTLKEAEYFAGHGIEDIQVAVCLTPDKLERAAGVARSIPRFSFFVDSAEAARAIAAAAMPFRVWIEIDSGEHRTGVAADGGALLEIANAFKGSRAFLAGVATHGGHSYRARSAEAITVIAEQEREAVVLAASRLRQAGFDVPGVSAGSTPTAVHARSGDGLTELRPGVYMAGDLFQAAIGSLARGDIAVSVLATVISHDRARGHLIVDAGGLALSKDRSTAALAGGDMGYGLVVDLDGEPAFGDLVVGGVHQEHGEVPVAHSALFDLLPVGARIRILPNHVCMTTAAYDRYRVVDGGHHIIDEWEKTAGW